MILFYPLVSDYVNSRNSGKAITDYSNLVTKANKKFKTKLLREARVYNQELAQTPDSFFHPELIPNYSKMLRLKNTDVMGYIDIAKIKVHLPIYHGTAESTLGDGIGHLKGTSLPIGGKSTHSVLVGHRGLPSATLFTDLDEIVKGDIFTITVMGRKITYKVDAIHVVKPTNSKYLQIVKGKDYCTLLTCTPYGINTKRLLIRGVRIKNLPASRHQVKSVYYLPLKKLIYYSVVIALLLLVAIWFINIFRHKRKVKSLK
jgi:sortase A